MMMWIRMCKFRFIRYNCICSYIACLLVGHQWTELKAFDWNDMKTRQYINDDSIADRLFNISFNCRLDKHNDQFILMVLWSSFHMRRPSYLRSHFPMWLKVACGIWSERDLMISYWRTVEWCISLDWTILETLPLRIRTILCVVVSRRTCMTNK